LGERSYSLFLVHCSVIVLVYQLSTVFISGSGAVFTALTRIVAAPLSLFVAMLLFHFVERQFAQGLKTANSFWPIDPTVARRGTIAIAPERS
jgi:peptidoglycan/LPS O-acetylase OafA/YrhL